MANDREKNQKSSSIAPIERAYNPIFQPFFELIQNSKKRRDIESFFEDELPLSIREKEKAPSLAIDCSARASNPKPLFEHHTSPTSKGLMWIEQSFNRTFATNETPDQELSFYREPGKEVPEDVSDSMMLLEMDMVSDSQVIISLHKEDEKVPTPTPQEWKGFFEGPAAVELANRLKEINGAGSTDKVIPVLNDELGVDFKIVGADGKERDYTTAEIKGLSTTVVQLMQQHLKDVSNVNTAVYKHPHGKKVKLAEFIQSEIESVKEKKKTKYDPVASRHGTNGSAAHEPDLIGIINQNRVEVDNKYCFYAQRNKDNKIEFIQAQYDDGQNEPSSLEKFKDNELPYIEALTEFVNNSDSKKVAKFFEDLSDSIELSTIPNVVEIFIEKNATTRNHSTPKASR